MPTKPVSAEPRPSPLKGDFATASITISFDQCCG
jgi:hypothetical protein